MATRRRDRNEFAQAIGEKVKEDLLRTLTGRPALPDGVVTILLTDVEGSTDLVRTLGDEQARTVLRQHDDKVRQAIKANHGTEVERVGDSFMAVFRLPRHALACALDIQRAFADPTSDRSILVRIGMDTGEAIAEEEGYFGRTVFRASRIAALARGGQILVSEATKVLGEPAGFGFDDAGEHELKGLGGGHRLFEVVAAPSP